MLLTFIHGIKKFQQDVNDEQWIRISYFFSPELGFLIFTNFLRFFFFLQAEFCTMFHARSVEITARASTTESTLAMAALDSLSAQSDATDNMFVSQSATGCAKSIKHIVTSVDRADLKSASRLE